MNNNSAQAELTETKQVAVMYLSIFSTFTINLSPRIVDIKYIKKKNFNPHIIIFGSKPLKLHHNTDLSSLKIHTVGEIII